MLSLSSSCHVTSSMTFLSVVFDASTFDWSLLFDSQSYLFSLSFRRRLLCKDDCLLKFCQLWSSRSTICFCSERRAYLHRLTLLHHWSNQKIGLLLINLLLSSSKLSKSKSEYVNHSRRRIRFWLLLWNSLELRKLSEEDLIDRPFSFLSVAWRQWLFSETKVAIAIFSALLIQRLNRFMAWRADKRPRVHLAQYCWFITHLTCGE